MGEIMEPTFVIVIKLNEFNPLKAFTTNVRNIGNAQYMLTTNIIKNLKRLKKEIVWNLQMLNFMKFNENDKLLPSYLEYISGLLHWYNFFVT